ncbi:MAG: heparinase II/III family protein, partial [Hyphomicrobiales bacterium]|nr:heparinase II/III family protein [Hyphomicrobiales bacterium]
IRKQSDYLSKFIHECRSPERRLRACIALCYVALSTQASTRHLNRVSRQMGQELNRQILADGGHISRNPALLIELLADLLPLRQVYASQNVTPPQALLNAIDRIGPMLRLFRHMDGNLALFNGMGSTPTDLVATLIAYQDALAHAMENAEPSGYQRLQTGPHVLMMDCGPVPAVTYAGFAHAGCLSFEYSDGSQRLIMNCGMPLQDNDEWRSAARLTQAHSTVGIGSACSAAFAPGYSVDWPRSPPLLSGAEHVSVVRGQNDDGLTLTARHDGYRRSYGIDHQRIITLSEAGTLFGEDHLLIHSANRAHKMDDEYHVRFHLHPALEVILDASLHQATLRGPDSRRWAFISADAPIYVEESIIFATPDGGRRSLQLVMRGRFRDTAVMRWELRKV